MRVLVNGFSTIAMTADNLPSDDERAARHRYFCFILASTAARSFEAGIVSSMLTEIKADLDIDYLREGVVASAPDFGIVPASILALWIFDALPAFPVLATCNCIIGAVTFTCALLPSFASLVAARAISGLCWGLSAVHYPAWINSKGDPKRRTSWLALCVPFVLSQSPVVSLTLRHHQVQRYAASRYPGRLRDRRRLSERRVGDMAPALRRGGVFHAHRRFWQRAVFTRLGPSSAKAADREGGRFPELVSKLELDHERGEAHTVR